MPRLSRREMHETRRLAHQRREARGGRPGTWGNPNLLYCYYMDRAGKREIRTINEYHMNMSYGGQTGLEAFLVTHCNTFELLGRVPFSFDDSSQTVTFGDDPETERVRNNMRVLVLVEGVEVARWFEEGTTWLDELKAGSPASSVDELGDGPGQ